MVKSKKIDEKLRKNVAKWEKFDQNHGKHVENHWKFLKNYEKMTKSFKFDQIVGLNVEKYVKIDFFFFKVEKCDEKE